MRIVQAPVKEIIKLDNNIFLQKVYCPEIAQVIKPGEFLNIKVSDTLSPFLRRPFSVCDVEGDYIYLMFNIFGQGTRILAHKKINDEIDILGSLGHGFNTDGDYDTAVMVAGGLGAAPFPFLTRLLEKKKNIRTYVGGRTSHDIIKYAMKNISVSTDDGSLGFKGTVISLLANHLEEFTNDKVKIFACGPTPMLKALKDFCIENDLTAEVSTECAMACGFGICMGCPIETTEHNDNYLLVCKDGPVFNIRDVNL